MTVEKISFDGKKVILVSATPLNNKYSDILSQLKLFQRPNRSNIPAVRNLPNFFKSIEKLRKEALEKDIDERKKIIQDLSRQIREKIFKHVMVRRTRKEIKEFFSKDIEHRFLDSQKDTILVDLDPLTVGASIQFEEIEFYRGTSTIKKKSEKKVKRLADFLALNAIVKIEIQGHVNAKGKNTPSNVRLSKKRAKRVLKKLIQNGIDKNRLTAVGLGNSAPVYPKPKHSYEEQANRRVEIMIK